MRGLGNINTSLEPTTEHGKELKQKLWIYLIVFVAVTLIKVFVLKGQGFMDIFNALFLYCGINAIDPCMLSFFVFISMFSLFEIVTILGTLIQHGTPLFKNGMAFPTLILFGSVALYIYGYWLVYEGYKEFKADRKENGAVGMGGVDYSNLIGGMDLGGGDDEAGNGNRGNRGNANRGGNSGAGGGGGSGFRAFQGQGVTLG